MDSVILREELLRTEEELSGGVVSDLAHRQQAAEVAF